MSSESIHIFPLSSHILPGGKLPVRIFEQRYIRMIVECSQNKEGFGVVMFDPAARSNLGTVLPIGTYVKIIDFYTLDDGFLGLVVQGVSRFTIESIAIQSDGLKVANVNYLNNWPQKPIGAKNLHLTEKLIDIFNEHSELDELYNSDKMMDEASWIAQRWIELLPISAKHKQTLIGYDTCDMTIELLNQLMEQ